MNYEPRGRNKKLGKSVITISRPVGETCPSDCFFLNNGCYAEKTENRFPHVVGYAEGNLRAKKSEIVELIQTAIKLKKSIRIHERGDFFRSGKLDRMYLRAWTLALQEFPVSELPDIWCYTHVYAPEIAALGQFGIHVYASVHSTEQIIEARKCGFKLFAFASDMKKKKGGSPDAPKYQVLPIIGNTLTCPEHRLGKDRVQCDTCRWCTRGKGNVLFLSH